MTVGIYSGSFDPVHNGHLMLARHIIETSLVDEVWMLVSRLNPLKAQNTPPASEHDRMEMCALATADFPALRADDTELALPSPSFSYRTLSFLRQKFPQHSFKLIVGADNISVFDRWKNHDRILSEFGVLVYPRPGNENISMPDGAQLISDCPLSEISSTEIRQTVAEGGDISSLTPKAVAQYIEENHLYRDKTFSQQ